MRGSSQLLINEPPLQVLPSLAKVIGLNEAIALQQIHYWMIQKKAFHRDGRTWVFNTYQQWHEDNFPFWSPRAIQRIMLNLEEMGLVIVEQFNLQTGDATKFYSINYDKLSEISTDPSSEFGTTHHPNLALPSSEFGTTPSEFGTILIRTETNTETNTERETPPPSPIIELLLSYYRNIVTTQREQVDLKNQSIILDAANASANEVKAWLESRRSLSSIGFIARDFKTWRANQARQNHNGQNSQSPPPPRYNCEKCQDRFVYQRGGQAVKCDCWQKRKAA